MSYGLRPRVSASPEEIATVTAIARELLMRQLVAPAPDATPAWRFSGRWFAAHPFSALRRPGA